jgi:hypothetical protein
MSAVILEECFYDCVWDTRKPAHANNTSNYNSLAPYVYFLFHCSPNPNS